MMRWQAGDLLVFHGRDWASRAIEIATRGPSHVGIVSRSATGGHVLYESTTLCDLPDRRTGQVRPGVQIHDPQERARTYAGRVARLRLAPIWELSSGEEDLLDRMLGHLHGARYDMAGALLSGTRVFKWTALMPYPDLGSLFCSELCAAVLMRLGRLPLANPGVYHPAALVRRLRRCGVYLPPVEVTKGCRYAAESI